MARIGIDMLAVQSPQHGQRGIGRYGANLVSAMLARDDEHDYILYAHDDLPADRIPISSRATVRTIRPRWDRGETMTPFMDGLVRENPDGLNAFLILTAFEQWALYGPPAQPRNGLKLAAVIHDLIPFLFPDDHNVDPLLVRHYRCLDELTRYDALLCNSEATRRDVLNTLRLPPGQVVTISAGSDPTFFTPAPRPAGVESRRVLKDLGVTRPFLFNVGGLDPRKNTWSLIEAFATLPKPVRDAHQLVLTFWISEWGRRHVAERLEGQDLGDSVVMTGEISDESLRVLYQQCEAFVFPSSYEGFGLPLLEAMHCGAPVIAGNNSSQIEVVGDAGLLVEASDVDDLRSKILGVLTEPETADDMRRRGMARAAGFSWSRSAEVAIEALTASRDEPRPARRLRFDRGHSRKPTIAFFSPLPPRKSGISDYSASLIEGLRKTYRIDLFHDSGQVPIPALASPEFMASDYGLFERFNAAKGYHAIVYQMGNSGYHNYLYPIMLRHPGLVTLHDFSLAGFHHQYSLKKSRGLGLIREELLRDYPEDRDAIETMVASWAVDAGDIARDCAQRGWHLNRAILRSSLLTLVHSDWCARQVGRTSPEFADRMIVVPHGIHPKRVDDARRAEIRDHYGISRDALVFASFGFVHPEKMITEALDAFRKVAAIDPTAVYLFVGESADGGLATRRVAELGLQERVRMLGRQPWSAFADLMLVTDVGVNLRKPPTNGETSGSLSNLLASGVATVVTDVGAFSDYSSDVVRKVRWEADGQDGLDRAVLELATRPDARNALGRAARDYVGTNHAWPRVTELYVEAIERCHRATRPGRAGPVPTFGGRANARA